MANAQKELLEEASRNGSLVAPSQLHRLANPPLAGDANAEAAAGGEEQFGGARWQWAALQVLLCVIEPSWSLP